MNRITLFFLASLVGLSQIYRASCCDESTLPYHLPDDADKQYWKIKESQADIGYVQVKDWYSQPAPHENQKVVGAAMREFSPCWNQRFANLSVELAGHDCVGVMNSI